MDEDLLPAMLADRSHSLTVSPFLHAVVWKLCGVDINATLQCAHVQGRQWVSRPFTFINID
jgi:hypothetical protein